MSSVVNASSPPVRFRPPCTASIQRGRSEARGYRCTAMRVLIVVNWFLKYATEQAAGLAEAGADVQVVCRDNLEEFAGNEQEWHQCLQRVTAATGRAPWIIRGSGTGPARAARCRGRCSAGAPLASGHRACPPQRVPGALCGGDAPRAPVGAHRPRRGRASGTDTEEPVQKGDGARMGASGRRASSCMARTFARC